MNKIEREDHFRFLSTLDDLDVIKFTVTYYLSSWVCGTDDPRKEFMRRMDLLDEILIDNSKINE